MKNLKLLATELLKSSGIEQLPSKSLRPQFDASNLRSIECVLHNESVWRSNSEAVRRLTNSFREQICARQFYCAISSASSGLHTVLSYYIRRRGKYIIVPSYTWYSVIATILNIGAIPLFIDLELPSLRLSSFDSLQIPPEQIACAVPSHLFGIPCLTEQHLSWLRCNDIPLVEDCAQCIRGQVGSGNIGQLGEASIYSFNGSKHIPAGEGGMIVTDSPDLISFCNNFIMSVDAPAEISVVRFNTASEGWNYRLASISASLAESLIRTVHLRIKDGQSAAETFVQLAGQFDFLTIAGFPYSPSMAHLGLPFYLNKPLGNLTLGESRELLYYMLRFAGVPSSVWVAEPVQQTKRMRRFYLESKSEPRAEDYVFAETFSESHIVIPADTRAFERHIFDIIMRVFQTYGNQSN